MRVCFETKPARAYFNCLYFKLISQQLTVFVTHTENILQYVHTHTHKEREREREEEEKKGC